MEAIHYCRRNSYTVKMPIYFNNSGLLGRLKEKDKLYGLSDPNCSASKSKTQPGLNESKGTLLSIEI